MPWGIISSVHSPPGNASPDTPCFRGLPANLKPTVHVGVRPNGDLGYGSSKGYTGQPVLPRVTLGSRRERTGQEATRPLPHGMCVLHDEPGKLFKACEGGWEGGKGDPHETPMILKSGGEGVGVGGRESRPPQDEDGRPRPLAFEKTETKGRSERVSSPWVNSWGVEERGRDAQRRCPLRWIEGAEPCAVQAARTVLNAGDEETYRKATRLVPTQPYGKTRPWHTLSMMPASHARNG